MSSRTPAHPRRRSDEDRLYRQASVRSSVRLWREHRRDGPIARQAIPTMRSTPAILAVDGTVSNAPRTGAQRSARLRQSWPRSSGPESTGATGAGSGLAPSRAPAMAHTESPSSLHTAWFTSFSLARSRTGSPSTISAGSGSASTLPTWNPSHWLRTCFGASRSLLRMLGRRTAPTAIRMTRRTPTSSRPAGGECAGHAIVSGLGLAGEDDPRRVVMHR